MAGIIYHTNHITILPTFANENSKTVTHFLHTHIDNFKYINFFIIIYFFYKNKQYLFPFMFTMITIQFYPYNISINETSYFQQVLHNKVKIKSEKEINKTNVTIFLFIYYYVHCT